MLVSVQSRCSPVSPFPALASAVIIGIFIYYAECVIRAAVVESQHDDQEFKTNLTLEVRVVKLEMFHNLNPTSLSAIGNEGQLFYN